MKLSYFYNHTIHGRNVKAISITPKKKKIFKGKIVLYDDQCFSLFSMSIWYHILSNLSQICTLFVHIIANTKITMQIPTDK